MKTQIYLLITLTFLISLTSCITKRIIDFDDPTSAGTSTITLPIGTTVTAIQTIIESGNLAGVATSSNHLVIDTLAPLTDKENYKASTKVNAIYVTESGAGTKNGANWSNAIAATELRKAIMDISDASAINVYVVLIGGGTYKPTDSGDPAMSFSMKNHTAIIGGFANSGKWERTGTTTFSGAIDAMGTTADGSYHVFSHAGITLDNGVLYGVTITKGNANGGPGTGGGMYNSSSSPRLVSVVFAENRARIYGGGMYNSGNSSPILKRVVFTGNNANRYGGGMYNSENSSPVLVGAVFRGNNARESGGGMYSFAISGGDGPVVVNSIFISNSITVTTGVGKDIVLDRSSSGNNINVRVAGSVIGVDKTNPTNGIVVTTTEGSPGSYSITHHSLVNGAVNFGSDSTTSGLTYPTIQGGSSAIDIGLYVRRSGSTYYFSQDKIAWYTKFLATGGFDSSSTATPPTGAEDLTATDIAGNTRVNRPDAGVHEYR